MTLYFCAKLFIAQGIFIKSIAQIFFFYPQYVFPGWKDKFRIFIKCTKRRIRRNKNEKKIFEHFIACISEIIKGTFFKFEMWLFLREGTSIVNLVPFRSDITELHTCEDCSCFLSVNILTVLQAPHFLNCMALYRVSWFEEGDFFLLNSLWDNHGGQICYTIPYVQNAYHHPLLLKSRSGSRGLERGTQSESYS